MSLVRSLLIPLVLLSAIIVPSAAQECFKERQLPCSGKNGEVNYDYLGEQDLVFWSADLIGLKVDSETLTVHTACFLDTSDVLKNNSDRKGDFLRGELCGVLYYSLTKNPFNWQKYPTTTRCGQWYLKGLPCTVGD